MGYLATNLSTIPSKGFSWYIFFLLDKWSDPLRDEVEKNFSQFAAEVGSDCLAVQGTDRVTFYNQILDSELMKLTLKGERPPLPALIVSNYSPRSMDDSRGIKDMSNAQLIIFPLLQNILSQVPLPNFLKTLQQLFKMVLQRNLKLKKKSRKSGVG